MSCSRPPVRKNRKPEQVLPAWALIVESPADSELEGPVGHGISLYRIITPFGETLVCMIEFDKEACTAEIGRQKKIHHGVLPDHFRIIIHIEPAQFRRITVGFGFGEIPYIRPELEIQHIE